MGDMPARPPDTLHPYCAKKGKNIMKNFRKRFTAWLLIFTLVFCMMPVNVWADEIAGDDSSYSESSADTSESADTGADVADSDETSSEGTDESAADVDSDSNVDSEADVDDESNVDDEADVDDESNVDDEADVDSDSNIDDEADVDDESNVDSEADVDDESNVDSEADVDDESNVDDEADVDDESNVDNEADVDDESNVGDNNNVNTDDAEADKTDEVDTDIVVDEDKVIDEDESDAVTPDKDKTEEEVADDVVKNPEENLDGVVIAPEQKEPEQTQTPEQKLPEVNLTPDLKLPELDKLVEQPLVPEKVACSGDENCLAEEHNEGCPKFAPQLPIVPVLSPEVQAFLDAVAQLPESVTKENLVDVTTMLENILPLFTQLTEEEQVSEEVAAAYMLALALWEQCEGVKALLLNDNAVITLEELQTALANEDMSIITLGADITGNIEINRDLTLDLGGLMLTGDGEGSVITVKGGNVTIQNGTVTGGKAVNGGGVYAGDGNLTLVNVNITDNIADGGKTKAAACGGGIYIDGANVVMNSGSISNNIARSKVVVSSFNPTVTYGGNGGGVYIAKGSFIMDGGNIVNNTASRETSGTYDNDRNGAGGGVFVAKGASFVLDGGNISDNKAYAWAYRADRHCGGGVYIARGQDAQLISGTISNNLTNSNGGGVYVDRGEISLTNIAITENGADNPITGTNGGGVWFCDMAEDSHFYATSGALITDNNSSKRGNDFFATEPWWFYGAERQISLATRLNDGTRVDWSDQETDVPADFTNQYKRVKLTQLGDDLTNANGETITHFTPFLAEEFQGVLDDIASVANVSLKSSTVIGGTYTLYITGNHAAQGGGIACNGSLIMGEDSDIKLTVQKVWDVEECAELPKEITVKVLNNGADFETLTLNAENGWQATLIDLPGDRTYTVEEVAVDGYVANYSDMVQSGDFDGESNREYVITITNKVAPETGNLIVSKTVKGEDLTEADKSTDFNFTVKLDDDKINGEYGEMTFENGVATFTLQDGQQKTAEGLPQGVGYNVEEEAAAGFNSSSNGAIGVIGAEDAKAEFVNTKVKEPLKPEIKTGDLTITKQIVGGGDLAAAKEYHFTVTGPNDYQQKVSITGAGSVTMSELQPGTYNVTEENAAIDGYTWSVEGNGNVLVIAEKNAEITITNSYQQIEPKKGSLSVAKKVVVDGGDLTDVDTSTDFNFTIKLSDSTVDGVYGDITFVAGVAEITLHHGERKTAVGLPAGVDYTVTEKETADYIVDAVEKTGVITEDGAEVEFTNTRTVTPPTPPTPPTPVIPENPENPGNDDPGSDDSGDDDPIEPFIPTIPLDQPPVPLTETPVEELILNEDVPLSGLPEDEEVLLDEEVPLAKVPKTGDNLVLWFFAALASGLAALGLSRKRG